jgi:hypothetical protein
LVVVKKDLQQARKDNQALARYINIKRKMPERRKRRLERRRRRRAARRRWIAKALRMSELGGSSPPRMVQVPLPPPASFE